MAQYKSLMDLPVPPTKMIRLIFVVITGHLVSATDIRIVCSANVDISQFPHQVSLEKDGYHVCGGAILSQTKILTTAHCVEGTSEQELKVRAGSGLKLQGGQLVDVAKIVSHPFYKPDLFRNDIAVIILAQNLTFNQNVRPVQIAVPKGPIRLFFVQATGWGETGRGESPDQLRVVRLHKIPATSCQKYLQTFNQTTMLCFTDTCEFNVIHGNSGDPVTRFGKLVGLIAYSPSVYITHESISVQTRVSAFTDFINSVN